MRKGGRCHIFSAVASELSFCLACVRGKTSCHLCGVSLWAIPLAKGRQSPPWEMKGPRRSAKVYTCWALTVPSVKSKDLALLFILGKDKRAVKSPDSWSDHSKVTSWWGRADVVSDELCVASAWEFSSITLMAALVLLSTPRIIAWIFWVFFFPFHTNHLFWVCFVLVD